MLLSVMSHCGDSCDVLSSHSIARDGLLFYRYPIPFECP